MKIRFYHWWVYRLYFWLWTPILIDKPQMTKGIHEFMGEWIKRDELRRNVADDLTGKGK